jgi:hypothetical protein
VHGLKKKVHGSGFRVKKKKLSDRIYRIDRMKKRGKSYQLS